MFNLFGKDLFLARRKEVQDQNGVQIEIFEKPIYVGKINYQQESNTTTQNDYGTFNSKVYKAIFPLSMFLGKISVGDRVYIIDDKIVSYEELKTIALQDDEYCNNANYYVDDIKVQNLILEVTFEKL